MRAILRFCGHNFCCSGRNSAIRRSIDASEPCACSGVPRGARRDLPGELQPENRRNGPGMLPVERRRLGGRLGLC